MDLKTIIVALDASTRNASTARAAAQLAAHRDARLIGLHVIDIPVFPAYIGGSLPAEVYEIQQSQYEGAAEEVKTCFSEACKAASIEGEWRCVEGITRYVVARQARYADLLVLGGPEEEVIGPPAPTLAEDMVLSVGKPVLVCSRSYEGGSIGKAITVAWDGSREASRSVTDAMGMLMQADKVTVIAIQEDDADPQSTALPGADLGEYLAAHGITARIEDLQPDGRSVSDVVLDHARINGSDLVVMGAYGHSRFRELLLGGATRGMLRNSEIPLLMSH
jgi:nucleotide-binding universal stress UspA family protein